MIDTHCHLTYPGLTERVDAVIDDAAAAGVDRMVCVGTGAEDAARSIAMGEATLDAYEGVVTLPVTVRGVSDRDGVELELRYQACGEGVCLPPRWVGVTLRADAGADGR